MDSTERQSLLQRFREEDGHQNPRGYQRHMGELFGSTSLTNSSVLEIGSGRGLLSLYCAASGAERVVSIEPELEGSVSGVVATQRKRIQAMELQNIELRTEDFHQTNLADEKFDIIVLYSVLNHLYETPENARHSRSAFDNYVDIARRLHSLLRSGGTLIASDACRYCIWTQLRRIGYPTSWCLEQRTIHWRIHQQPNVWKNIFRSAGFDHFAVRYPVPFRLRYFRWFLENAVANFAIMGSFILHAKKASD